MIAAVAVLGAWRPAAGQSSSTESQRRGRAMPDESRGSKEHFGLGLSITGQIVTDLKGTLHLENAPGKGALVRVSIPL